MDKSNNSGIILIILAIILIFSIAMGDDPNDNVLKHYDTVKIKLDKSSEFEEYRNVDIINRNTLQMTYTIKLEDGSIYTINYSQLKD